MDKELELENKFIQLWNDGNSYDEISEIIGVDVEKIGEWGTNLIIANNELFDEEKFAVNKTNDSKYIGQGLEAHPYKFLFKLKKSIDRNYWDIIKIRLPHSATLIIEEKENKRVTFFFRFFDEAKLDGTSETYYNSFELTSFDSFRGQPIEIKQNYEFRVIANAPLIKKSLDKRLFYGKFLDLPFCVKQFALKNFHGVKNILVQELPVNCQWIFLTGENGYGKTTILKALAKTLIDRNIHKRIAVELKINNKNHLFDPYFKVINLQNFASYGASRLVLQQPDSKNEIGRKSEALYSLFNTDGILLNIEIELVFWKLENDSRFEKVKQLLISVVPYLKDIIVKKREVLYVEESSEKESYQPVTFDELAAGYKSVIAMVGDIYLRLSKHQPDVEIEDLGGIVLIDELDVHLHPKWQRKLPGLLSKAFPKVQFIASTHSPIPFLGAPKNAVFLKVDRTPEKGITCERIDIDVTNLTPNLILSSPIFGFEELISDDAKNNIGEVRTEDSYKELKENEALRKRLLEFENSDKDFPDELFKKKTKTSNPS